MYIYLGNTKVIQAPATTCSKSSNKDKNRSELTLLAVFLCHDVRLGDQHERLGFKPPPDEGRKKKKRRNCLDLFNTDFNGCVFPLVGANGPHNRQKIDPLTPRTRLFTESMETCDVEEMGEREFSSEEREKKTKNFSLATEYE